MECFICHKHAHPQEIVGEWIAESGGLFLSHFPFVPEERATRGHLIIEPGRHIEDLSEMTDGEASVLGLMIRRASEVQRQVLKAEHVYLFRINDKVKHLHFHLVPRYPGTPREFWGREIMTDWPGRPTVGLREIQELAREMRKVY